ncbi:MAG TPA: DUF4349 domain-containing protein [Flavisolibacter sp.]|nr:DUF4349 domain-containing protein [Flavisolibacter sp.]
MKRTLSLFTLFAVLLLGCQYNTPENSAMDTLSDSTSITGLSGNSVKLVKTASIHFKVTDVTHSAREVSTIAQKLGGMIFDQSLSAEESDRHELKLSSDSLLVITTYIPQASITARVPSEQLETFLYNVADLGYYTSSSNLHIDDRSLAYLENVLKQQNRATALAQPIKRDAASNLETIAVRDEAIAQHITNRAIDADVKYSTVTLSLFQNPLIRKEVIANYVLADYQLPFGKRLGHAFSDGWEYFLAFVIALSHFWMFILVGVGLLISYKYWQKRNLARI